MNVVSWDQSRLNAAIAERMKYPGRDAAQIVNNAAYWVARNAAGYTPFVTVNRIDLELMVHYTPGRTKKGRPSKAKKNMMAGSFNLFSQGKLAFNKKRVPFAALIINAQVNYQSVYNSVTNRRYYRTASPFKGVPRAAGRQRMRAAENRMIRARHSSTKFLRSGWLAPIAELAVSVGRTPPVDGLTFSSATKGFAVPARAGTWNVFATVANEIGLSGRNGPSHNQALLNKGRPALNAAMHEEADKMMAKIREYQAREAEKFNAMCR